MTNRTFTDSEGNAVYHCGIGKLLTATYKRDFSMLEMGKCKTLFPTFSSWYETLNEEQKNRVSDHLDYCYGRKKT